MRPPNGCVSSAPGPLLKAEVFERTLAAKEDFRKGNLVEDCRISASVGLPGTDYVADHVPVQSVLDTFETTDPLADAPRASQISNKAGAS